MCVILCELQPCPHIIHILFDPNNPKAHSNVTWRRVWPLPKLGGISLTWNKYFCVPLFLSFSRSHTISISLSIYYLHPCSPNHLHHHTVPTIRKRRVKKMKKSSSSSPNQERLKKTQRREYDRTMNRIVNVKNPFFYCYLSVFYLILCHTNTIN